mmetsp:Transcript_744/g.1149  ORF Transcript_744/g.1149 Transcript_744/m.1149 type:complete len:259 (+) Transcript_744:1754-2530(+)
MFNSAISISASVSFSLFATSAGLLFSPSFCSEDEVSSSSSSSSACSSSSSSSPSNFFRSASENSAGKPSFFLYSSINFRYSLLLRFNFLSLSLSESMIRCSCAGDRIWFNFTLHLMDFARCPKFNVEMVSSALNGAGEHAQIIVVFEFPPNDCCKIRVSFEFLNGMCFFFSTNAFIHCPSADKEALIRFASSNVCPVAPVFPTFSDPAKSTKFKDPCLTVPVAASFCNTRMIKTEWDLDDTAFIFVDATTRLFAPTSK